MERPVDHAERSANHLLRGGVLAEGSHPLLVVFGEGNLISNQTAGCCPAASQDGLIALLDFVVRPGHRARARRIRYVPTWVRHPDYTVMRAAPGSPSWKRTVSVAGRRRGIGPVRPR